MHNNNNNVIDAPRPWRPFPTLKINDAVAAQSYNNIIHNDRDGNGVDAVYYTRLAVSESQIPHNSGDETPARVCANRPVIYVPVRYHCARDKLCYYLYHTHDRRREIN